MTISVIDFSSKKLRHFLDYNSCFKKTEKFLSQQYDLFTLSLSIHPGTPATHQMWTSWIHSSFCWAKKSECQQWDGAHTAAWWTGFQAVMVKEMQFERHRRYFFSLPNLGRDEFTSPALIPGMNNPKLTFLEPFFWVNVWCVELFLQG